MELNCEEVILTQSRKVFSNWQTMSLAMVKSSRPKKEAVFIFLGSGEWLPSQDLMIVRFIVSRGKKWA